MTTFSPHTVGRVATRRSILRPLAVIDSRPSCGLRRSAMSMSLMIFSRLVTPDGDRLGRAHDLVQHAVDPVADPQAVLGRLDVDVAGPVLDGLGDEHVDVLDDRGVLDDLADLGELVLASRPCVIALRDVVHVGVGAAEPLDRGEQVVAGGHDGPRLPPGDLPDVVQGEDVAGVGHRERRACLLVVADGQDGVPARDGGSRTGDGGRVDRVLGQVDEVQADLARERCDELGLGDVAHVDEHAAERLPARSCSSQASSSCSASTSRSSSRMSVNCFTSGAPASRRARVAEEVMDLRSVPAGATLSSGADLGPRPGPAPPAWPTAARRGPS